jgi:hypothetical protein
MEMSSFCSNIYNMNDILPWKPMACYFYRYCKKIAKLSILCNISSEWLVSSLYLVKYHKPFHKIKTTSEVKPILPVSQ